MIVTKKIYTKEPSSKRRTLEIEVSGRVDRQRIDG